MMKTRPFVLFLLLLFMLTSCSSTPPKLPERTQSSEGSTSQDYVRDGKKALEIINRIKELPIQQTFGINMFSGQDSFYINKTLYVTSYYLGEIGLYEVNPATGKLEAICRDPLCQHNTEDCIMRAFSQGFTTNGKDVFALHGDSISRVDLVEGKLVPMCKWTHAPGAMCCCIACDEEYIYFAACTSDTTNEIYRMPAVGGKPEQLSNLGEHIITFTVSDGFILFRNAAMTLKCAPIDFSEVVTLGEKATTMTSENGRFFYCDMNQNLFEVDIDTKTVKEVAQDIAYYRAFLCDGVFYYHKDDFNNTKTIYCYDINTGETTSITLDSELIVFNTGKFSFDTEKIVFHNDVDDVRVFGEYGEYLLLFMYDCPINDYTEELVRYFFFKKDGSEIAEVFFESFTNE